MTFQHKSAIIALCLAAAALTGCTASAPTAVTAATTQPVETTAATVAATVPAADVVLAHQEDEGILKAWEIDVSRVWSSSNGADITVKAQPREYVDGQLAVFDVTLDGNEVKKEFCEWDGSCYCATVELDAANGYEFDLILYPPKGDGETFSMTGAYDTISNLQNSLTSYCNLYISDTKIEDNKFSITAGFANVQLPLLSPAEGPVLFDKARLVFKLNDTEISACDVELPAGEGKGSYESALDSISFDIPAMESEDRLELVLEASFTNGDILAVSGGIWSFNNGQTQVDVG